MIIHGFSKMQTAKQLLDNGFFILGNTYWETQNSKPF
jgi:hypothetical protein